MSARLIPTTAWCAVSLMAVAGIGEGWHLVPGAGHMVEFPGGYRFYVGSTRCGERGESSATFGQPSDRAARRAADCAICGLQGQTKASSPPIATVKLHLNGTNLQVPDPVPVHLRPTHPFRVRAPPGHRIASRIV